MQELVNELLEDYARMFNNLYPEGFKKPLLKSQGYSLDLRQRVIKFLRKDYANRSYLD